MEQGLEMVVVGLVAGFLRPSRDRRSNLYFSDTVLHLRVRNISCAPIQYIWCNGQNPFLTAQSTQIKSVISVPIKDFIHHYPRALFNDIPRVDAHFYDIPGSVQR